MSETTGTTQLISAPPICGMSCRLATLDSHSPRSAYFAAARLAQAVASEVPQGFRADFIFEEPECCQVDFRGGRL